MWPVLCVACVEWAVLCGLCCVWPVLCVPVLCGLCCVWPVSVMAISMTACSSWCGGHEGPAARRLVAGDILNDGVKCQTASGILVPFRMIS